MVARSAKQQSRPGMLDSASAATGAVAADGCFLAPNSNVPNQRYFDGEAKSDRCESAHSYMDAVSCEEAHLPGGGAPDHDCKHLLWRMRLASGLDLAKRTRTSLEEVSSRGVLVTHICDERSHSHTHTHTGPPSISDEVRPAPPATAAAGRHSPLPCCSLRQGPRTRMPQ